MWSDALDESQTGIKIAEWNNNLRYADNTTLMAESEEELKSLLMRVKEDRQKAGLKLNIRKTKIMASGSIMGLKKWKQWQILFSWTSESLQMVTTALILKDPCSLQGKLWLT